MYMRKYCNSLRLFKTEEIEEEAAGEFGHGNVETPWWFR